MRENTDDEPLLENIITTNTETTENLINPSFSKTSFSFSKLNKALDDIPTTR